MLFGHVKLDHLAVMDCQLNVSKTDCLKRLSDAFHCIADKAGPDVIRLMEIPICHFGLLDWIYSPLK
jgi:hypothetical protein